MKSKGYSWRLATLVAGALLASGLWTASAEAADLSLAQAIEMALSQNTSLKVTQKAEDTAAAARKEAKGNNGASVESSDGLSTSKKSGNPHKAGNSLSISGSLPLYTGGKNQANIKRAELGVETAALTTDRERENVKLDVVQAYYNALEAKKTIDVDQESVDNYEAHYTNVSQLYSAGSKARIDVLRSSVELSNARQTLIKAQNAYEVDIAKLRNLLNIDRSEPLNLTTDFSYDKFDIDMDSCIAYAYRNRKDLLVDQYNLDRAELAVTAAKAGFKPTLSLSLGAGQNNNFNPNSTSSQDVSAGITASWNVFDSGVTKAAVQAAEASRDTAKLNLVKDQENIDYALRQAYYNMREAEKRFNSTGDAVNQAEEDYYIAREKYRAGEGLMLDIIDAQLALSQAKLNYISAQYDYARYKAEVENVMGMGLNDSENQAARLLSADAEAALQSSPAAKVTGQPQSVPEAKPTAAKTSAKAKKAKKAKRTAKEQTAAAATTPTTTTAAAAARTTNATGSESAQDVARDAARS